MNFLSRAVVGRPQACDEIDEPPLILSHGLMAAAYDRGEVDFAFAPLAVAHYLGHWWIEQADAAWRRLTVPSVIEDFDARRPGFRPASGNYARTRAVARAADSVRESDPQEIE